MIIVVVVVIITIIIVVVVVAAAVVVVIIISPLTSPTLSPVFPLNSFDHQSHETA